MVFAITVQPKPDLHGMQTALVVPGHAGAVAATLATLASESSSKSAILGCTWPRGRGSGPRAEQPWMEEGYGGSATDVCMSHCTALVVRQPQFGDTKLEKIKTVRAPRATR